MHRRFNVLLVWSMDRLGRSLPHVAQAMGELDAPGAALISEQQGINGTGSVRACNDADGYCVR